jgi:glycosyltransferase involved in cell wall biosynthesis
MRILHLIWDLSGGGAERQLSYLATELASNGHEVHVAFCNDGPNRQEMPGVVLHRLAIRSNHDLSLLLQVFMLIKRIKPDIIHTWLMQMDIIGGISALLARIPQVFREPSSSMAYQMNLKNRLRIWAAGRSKAIVSNSRAGDEYWAYLLPRSRRHIVVNGLPIERINVTEAALPAGLIKTKTPIVLYAGRIIPDKNLESFIAALDQLRHRQPVLGVICGEGSHQNELEFLISSKGMGKYIHFTGFLPAASVWALMKKAAVFVSLSDYEGCPNTVMEAMACGCPIVLSDIPAHREIADEKCAILVNGLKIEQIADSLYQGLINVDQSRQRALIAQRRANEWSVDRMTGAYEEIYCRIVKEDVLSRKF